ncbi:MAG: Cytochrome c-type biogenesis protein CcmH [Alphaproteobacteria bacterium MarineAlpha5_Bin8]|nr:MAG: Cytochrome c-type biogenesis protein CcmH [Alphaproteobacteria bacterium MarineAlpha5_Bin7]PPR46369.1 MAG: Cytochrome c-type biogenesis protein CcmH [Alphaproteobacteria bacterium MarineAlpha5_Bin8]PPR54918.1 MAG: Cytochrome c-type biogenesis protein CcmH [Alphaproteobacteria bacterium MarineAlpha5_Bin6]|tara:strand:+ start:502 stop:900 length:399 start_codon:yes stop_codon:yes gene_type:complete
MKLYHYSSKVVFIILVIIYTLNTNHLQAKNNVDEDFEEITKKLRCMTCQNQSIYDSETEFAQDIKKIIMNKLNKGKSQKEILDFLVARYGEYILFEPQFNKKNMFLWIFPFFIFCISAIFLFIRINKNRISK